MTFSSGKEMLEVIKSGTDLYNPEKELYVFCYNIVGSIVVYRVTNEDAEKLKKEDEYWGAYLGIGGSIYDDPDYEDYEDDDYNNLDWCNDNYDGEWEDVTQ